MNHKSIDCTSNVAKQKIVTSGKVYRQIFDAEVQLVSSLLAKKCGKLDLNCGGMAQAVSSPCKSSCTHENELENLRTEVLVLPDIVPKNTSPSNILEKIKTAKSSKHQEAINHLKKKISFLGEKLKQEVGDASDLFLEDLSKSHSFVKNLLCDTDDHETLNLMTLEQLQALWKNIEEENAKRNEMIKTFEEKMVAIETTRMLKMLELFEETRKKMAKIGSKSDPELDKFITNQSQVLNKTMISNKRECSKLIANIRLNDFEFEQNNFSVYKEKMNVWRDTQQKMIMGKFSSLMDSEAMKNPTHTQFIIQEIIKKQSSLNEKRIEVFLGIKSLSLFDASKKKLTDLKDSIFEISKEIDQVYEDNFRVICTTYEGIHCMGLLQYQNLKSELMFKSVCTEREADDMLKVSCHHLLASQKQFFEKIIDKLDRDIGRKNETSLKMLKALFQFCDVVIEIWTNHKQQMALTEKTFMEESSAMKAAGFASLQNTEARLNLATDQLRQSSSLETLQSKFEEVNKIVQEMMTCRRDDYKVGVESLNKLGPSMSRLASSFILEMLNHLGKNESDSKTETDASDKEDSFANVLNSIRMEGDGPEKMNCEDSKSVENVEGEEPTILLCYLKDYSDLVEVKVEDVLDAKVRFEENVLSDLKNYSSKIDHKNELFVKQQTESLTNELELQIHVLHGRLKTLKDDVFDVRRAEIELHSERFSSHKTGAVKVLTDSKYKITELLQKHSSSMKEFKRKVEILECEANCATKSSRMKKLIDAIKSQHEMFVEEMKNAARMFVAEIDRSTRELHVSNLTLDRTLILFADGGNFCLEESKDYRQQISQLMADIISCEELIMRSVEGVESKQYQRSLAVVRRFEATYGIKFSFLEFEENCEKLFRSLRFKLRNVLLENNEREKKIKKKISFMTEVLNRDQPVYMSQYLDFVAETNQMLMKQATFLDHIFVNDLRPPPSMSKTMAIDLQPDSQTNLFSKGDRNALAISKPQKSILNDELLGVLSHLYGSKGPTTPKAVLPIQRDLISSSSIKSNKATSTEIESPKIEAPHENESEDSLKGIMKLSMKECFKNIGSSFETVNKQHNKIPKEFACCLWSGSQKRFDETMACKMNEFNELINKYHLEALQEFRADVKGMEDAVSQMFANTMKKMCIVNVGKFKEDVDAVSCNMKEVANCSDITKAYHLGCLRPNLGHPQNENAFDELRRRERTRSNNLNKCINCLLVNKLKSMLSFMPKFLKQLVKYVENSFRELDKLYLETIEDSTENKNMWGDLLRHEIYIDARDRIRTFMSKLPNNDVDKEGGDDDDTMIDKDSNDLKVTSLKKTRAHLLVHECAVELQENFFTCIGQILAEIETDQNERNCEKKALDKYWNSSIKEIKSLYV